MSRRKFIQTMAGGAGLVGMSSAGLSRIMEAQGPHRAFGGDPTGPAADLTDWLPSYTRAQQYRTRKQTSYDRTGGNEDMWQFKAGETREIFSATGAGAITHIWFTGGLLKESVLRIYWDGSDKPSVETPLGDFFGLNLGETSYYESQYLSCTPGSSLNAYFTMPYRNGARATVTNESKNGMILYYQVDYVEADSLPADALYFHAQYRQATPTVAQHLPEGKNLDGKYNYVFCETHGRGHLMGVTLGVVQTTGGWMGEGDDMTFIDDPDMPKTNGTGLEDYFCGSWGFSRKFANRQCGVTLLQELGELSRSGCYRFHGENPIAFTTYLKHTIEHGTGNDRSDNYFSVAYWYQDHPSTEFPPLPSLDERMKGLFNRLDVQGVSVPWPSTER